MSANHRVTNAGATPRLTLVRNPGASSQRAVRVVDADKPFAQTQAVRKAREIYGETVELAWLDQTTQTYLPI